MADVSCELYFQHQVRTSNQSIMSTDHFQPGQMFKAQITGLTPEQANFLVSEVGYSYMQASVIPESNVAVKPGEHDAGNLNLEERLKFLEKRLERLERFERR